MSGGNSVSFVIIIFTSLIFSTVLISWFMLQMYGISVSGIALPQGNTNYATTQDFTNNNINLSTFITQGEDTYNYQSGIGRVLGIKTGNNYFSNTWNYLFINNIQKDQNGDIINTYHINNSIKKDYTIVIRYAGFADIIELTISDDGIHQPVYSPIGIMSSPKIISYPDMNKITDVNIITKYNEDKRICDITFNGNTYTIIDLFTHGILPLANYYGGVASASQGFTIQSFNSASAISDDANSNILNQFAAFLIIAFKLVAYNVDSQYLPWELNILLIKTQTIALAVGLFNLRSGS